MEKKCTNHVLLKLMTAFGFFAPAPIVSFFSVTAYVWFLLLTTLYVIFIEGLKIKSGKRIFKFLLLSLSVSVSAVICFCRMPSTWTNGLFKQMVQLLCVLIIFIYTDGSKKKTFQVGYIRGVYFSAVVQMLWGYLQLILDGFGIDLNTLIFRNLMHMFSGVSASSRNNWGIKISGFCWNAGNYAPIMLIGYLLSKNRCIKIAFLLVSLLSGSRTLMIGIIVCLALQIIYGMLLKKTISKKGILLIISFLLLSVIFYLIKRNEINDKIFSTFNLLNISKNYYIEGSTNTHLNYFFKTPIVTQMNDIISNLFGFGPGCSGYAFTSRLGFYSDLGKWTIECDYIDHLWSYGYVGFTLYYIWFFSEIKCTLNVDKKQILLWIPLLLMSLAYNITFAWVLLFEIMVFSLAKFGISVFSLDLKNVIKS